MSSMLLGALLALACAVTVGAAYGLRTGLVVAFVYVVTAGTTAHAAYRSVAPAGRDR